MTGACSFDLVWSREGRAEIFEKMKKEGVLKYMMYHKVHPALEDWLTMTEPGDEVDVYKMYWHGEWCGIFYLSPGFNRTPLFHYVMWKPYRKHARSVCCAATEYVFSMYEIPAVMGLTPFKHMLPLMHACEWEVLGVVPGACVAAGSDGEEQVMDGVISVKRRD